MADGKYTFRVDDRAHKTQIARRGRGDLRGPGRRACGPRRCARSRSAAACTAGAPAPGRRRSSSWRRATGSSCSRAPRSRNSESTMAITKDKANQPRAAVRHLPAPRGADRRSSPTSRSPRASPSRGGRNTHGRVTVAPSRRRRQAPLPRDRLQAPQGRRAGARSRRSSTTPTAPATSRSCTTRTARSATSSPRRACAPATRSSPASGPTSGPAMRCRCARSRPEPSSTTSSSCPGQGGRLGRAAGSGIQVAAKEGPMVTLRLPSSEMRMVRADCRATVGDALERGAPEREARQGRAQAATRARARRPAASR